MIKNKLSNGEAFSFQVPLSETAKKIANLKERLVHSMTYQFRKLESSFDACVTRLHTIVSQGYNDTEFLDKLENRK